MIAERLLNLLLYLSLLALDLICFAFLCMLPAILVGGFCALLLRDESERNFIITMFSLSALRAALRGVNKKLFKKR